MERTDLDCKCYHRRISHHRRNNGCAILSINGVLVNCKCKQYVPDNLKYLEMLSKEKEVADLK